MEPQAGEFVQILNVGECHWVTISTIRCPASTIKVYDSLHMKISSQTKKLIADLLMTQENLSQSHILMCSGKVGAVTVDCLHWRLPPPSARGMIQ